MSPKLRDPEGKCGSNQTFGASQQRKEAESFTVHGRNQAAREQHRRLVRFLLFCEADWESKVLRHFLRSWPHRHGRRFSGGGRKLLFHSIPFDFLFFPCYFTVWGGGRVHSVQAAPRSARAPAFIASVFPGSPRTKEDAASALMSSAPAGVWRLPTTSGSRQVQPLLST